MQGRADSESSWLPAGLQAVLIADPNWAQLGDVMSGVMTGGEFTSLLALRLLKIVS